MSTTDTPASIAKELGLKSAIPEGIDPSEVAARKKELIRCGAADSRTLNGEMIAESIALQAAEQQAMVNKRVAEKAARDAARFLQRNEELAAATLPPGGDLTEMLARMDAEPLRGVTPAHPLTSEAATVSTPRAAAL